jgi:HEAT repeat protein
MPDHPTPDDGGVDRDTPEGVRYDPDLAVHEPMEVPAAPIEPGRHRSPLIAVLVGVGVLSFGVYLLFGLIAREGRSPSDYLDEVRRHREGSWQAALDLSRVVPTLAPADLDPSLGRRTLAAFQQAADDDPRVRRYLALALGEMRVRPAVDALVGALHEADLQTRLYAAWALGAIGEARAVQGLAPLLQSDEADLRETAAYALGAIGAPEAAAALRPLLNDPVQDVAWNAALALARLGDRSGLPLIGRMLDRGYLDAIRREDEAGAPRPMSDAQKEEALLNALTAIRLLRDGGHAALVRKLRDGDPSLRVRQAAAETLAASGS